MTPATRLRELDLHDDADLRAFHRVRWASLQHGRPHVVPSAVEDFARTWRAGPDEDGWRKRAVGAFVGDELVSVAYTQECTDDALDTAWVGVHTHPDHQRRGHGSAVADALWPLVGVERTRLLTSAAVPDGTAPHGYRRFAQRHGFVLGTSATVVERSLTDPLPDVPAVAPGYRVESHVDGVPPRWRPGLGVLMGLVDADAPSGDIAWDAEPVSPEHYARDVAAACAGGGHVVETIALHGDDVVAFTRVETTADPARPAIQEGTLVLTGHRRAGLGRAVKVANLHALRAAAPGHERITSESDDANAPMRALNVALGFRPVETLLYLHRAHP